jgi:hypothetical protein
MTSSGAVAEQQSRSGERRISKLEDNLNLPVLQVARYPYRFTNSYRHVVGSSQASPPLGHPPNPATALLLHFHCASAALAVMPLAAFASVPQQSAAAPPLLPPPSSLPPPRNSRPQFHSARRATVEKIAPADVCFGCAPAASPWPFSQSCLRT